MAESKKQNRSLSQVGNMWKIIQEVDLRPTRDEAEHELRFVIVDLADGAGNQLVDQLRTDPDRPDIQSNTPVMVLNGETITPVDEVDLWLVAYKGSKKNQKLLETWLQAWNFSKEVYLMISLDDGDEQTVQGLANLRPGRTVRGDIHDIDFLQRVLVPSVLGLLPAMHIAIARQFPLFRQRVARKLISETCFSNAAYSLSTGVAEIIPVLDIPLNVADMVVLTKAQGFLVYKLGLALGLSTEWRDYIAEFGSVLGGGFLWRQIARSLVGLIPVWGIIPKVVVAYSGTYVVGHVVLQWYLTGKHLTRAEMRELSRQAIARGREVAKELAAKMPRPKLRGRKRKAKELNSGDEKVCPACGKQANGEAKFCQFCGEKIS